MNSPATNLIVDIARAAAQAAALPRVYPGHIMQRIKMALLVSDPEGVITSTGQIESIGDCRYGLTITDLNGTEYRITVEVNNER